MLLIYTICPFDVNRVSNMLICVRDGCINAVQSKSYSQDNYRTFYLESNTKDIRTFEALKNQMNFINKVPKKIALSVNIIY